MNTSDSKTIGVLSLQGGYARHLQTITTLGHKAVTVRDVLELEQCEALIIPGGESTTIAMLLSRRGLDKAILEKIQMGFPIFGTCAGMILLASQVEGRRDFGFNCLDIAVERNAYGAQTESFEATVHITHIDEPEKPFPAVFIRAPRVINHGKNVEILAYFEQKPVLLRQGNILASSFHPELTSDLRIHNFFIHTCVNENN